MGGLIFGWAYIRNDESVSKLVGLYMGGLIFGGLRYSILPYGNYVINHENEAR